MALYLITGVPGSGKSTVNAELKSRGFESYDGDEDHLAEWYSTKTGRAVKVNIEQCTPEFLLGHTRDISRETVEGLVRKAKNKPVFLCGDPENEEELLGLFDKVFALMIAEETMRQRLATRTNSNWGKRPLEIEYSLAFKEKWLPLIKKYDYVTIDSTQPTKEIVDRILKETGQYVPL